MIARWLVHPIALSAALLCGPAQAQEVDLDARIRDYILRHPEIIVEALELLSQREAQAALQQKLAAYPDLFSRPAELGIGAPDAPVQVVEFFDYRCVPCKVAHPQLERLVARNPQLRIEMRHLPILSPESERAARFALAVQDKYGVDTYRRVHARLWHLRGPLNTAGFAAIATAEGLDFDALDAAMRSDWIDQRIAENREMAIALEVLGTPAFVSQNGVSFGAADVGALARTWLADDRPG